MAECYMYNINNFGQVLLRGRHVFMGYCGMDEETSQIIDDKRWLHSGDIGEIDEVNTVYIKNVCMNFEYTCAE